MLNQLGTTDALKWGYRLLNFKECEDKRMELCFQVNGELKNTKADLVVGADGIYSAVRSALIKGQGANQALLDALLLARSIWKGCTNTPNWKEIGLRKTILEEFENEMLDRSASKVKDSAKACELLHSKDALRRCNQPKGRLFSIEKI